LSDQQLATADQSNAPDIPATLATRRGLKLPAFPVAAAPPDSSRVAPCVALDLPRTKQVAKGNLRRFPLRSGRPLIGGERSSTRAMPQPVAPPLATLTPQHDAPTRSRRVLLPAAPAEPQVVAQEVRAQAYPALTGAGSIIDRKVSLPSPPPPLHRPRPGTKPACRNYTRRFPIRPFSSPWYCWQSASWGCSGPSSRARRTHTTPCSSGTQSVFASPMPWSTG
jgi:hypothetical protein